MKYILTLEFYNIDELMEFLEALSNIWKYGKVPPKSKTFLEYVDKIKDSIRARRD